MTIITPQFKLIFTYDILPGKQDEYQQFVLRKFIPGIQTLNLYVIGVYHTVFGDYPARQAEFVSESWEAMQDAINSSTFTQLESSLRAYTTNYSRKIVRYRRGFQF